MSLEAITLFTIADKAREEKYPELWDMLPEYACEVLNMTPLDYSKVLACLNVFHNHHVFDNWHIFEKACREFNDLPVNFNVTQPPTPCELIWAIECMRELDPVSHFSSEVLSYIAVLLYEDGICIVPEKLKNEKTFDDISFQFIFNSLIPTDVYLTEEQNHIQLEMQNNINKYCEHFRNKLQMELGSV